MAENHIPQLFDLFNNNPNISYTFKEVHEEIKGDYYTVYSQLRYLIRSKIVVISNNGREKVYQRRSKN